MYIHLYVQINNKIQLQLTSTQFFQQLNTVTKYRHYVNLRFQFFVDKTGKTVQNTVRTI